MFNVNDVEILILVIFVITGLAYLEYKRGKLSWVKKDIKSVENKISSEGKAIEVDLTADISEIGQHLKLFIASKNLGSAEQGLITDFIAWYKESINAIHMLSGKGYNVSPAVPAPIAPPVVPAPIAPPVVPAPIAPPVVPGTTA